MKQSEFRRWLARQGAEFEEGSKHIKIIYKDKISYMPRQPSREIKEGTRKAILKQLGLN